MPSTRYFLTLCTQGREPILTELEHAERIVTAWRTLQAAGDLTLLAATVMPDHVHALFVLHDRLPLERVMGKFKTLARDKGRVAWRWQQNGYEHRLRENEDSGDYGFYVFMNPYRAGLIETYKPWPWWSCPKPSSFAFLENLNERCLPPEWLERFDQVASRIVAGE